MRGTEECGLASGVPTKSLDKIVYVLVGYTHLHSSVFSREHAK